MNAVRDALADRLAADAGITALVASTGGPFTGVYHRQAPKGAPTPFVLFTKMAGTPTYTFGGLGLQSDVWLAKAVDRNANSGPAEDLAAAITACLTDAPLSIAGSPLLYLRRISDVDYGEPDGDHMYVHVGATWRLVTEPA